MSRRRAPIKRKLRCPLCLQMIYTSHYSTTKFYSENTGGRHQLKGTNIGVRKHLAVVHKIHLNLTKTIFNGRPASKVIAERILPLYMESTFR